MLFVTKEVNLTVNCLIEQGTSFIFDFFVPLLFEAE